MSNLTLRIITGTVFIAFIIAAIIAVPLIFQFVFLMAALLSANEFINLNRSEDVQIAKYPALIVVGLIYCVISGLVDLPVKADFAVSIISICLLFYIELFRKKKMPFHNIAYAITAIIYIAVPFAVMVRMAYSAGEYNYWFPLSFFLILWMYDSFAYVFGSWLGKNRLFERISPKKSWEGLIGGMVMAFVTAFIIYKVTGLISLVHWLVIAALISIAGTLGDLAESMLKRSLQKKDSGSLLPGHGGMLDRFDAMLLSAPVVYAYLMLAL